jgi:cytochrome c553
MLAASLALAAVAAFAGVGTALAQSAGSGASAAQIANAGAVNQGTPACASCHGFRGEGVRVQNGPRLAGLDADYIARQLDGFAHGKRDSSVMVGVARSLTEAQRDGMAQYYASLPPVGEPPGMGGDMVRLGRAIAHEGDWSVKVPPCGSCHGGDGLGVNSLAPPLAGQRADYLERQLIRFRQNERRDDPLGLMRGLAGRLSMREIRAVAAYYATLPPKPLAPGPSAKGVRR